VSPAAGVGRGWTSSAGGQRQRRSGLGTQAAGDLRTANQRIDGETALGRECCVDHVRPTRERIVQSPAPQQDQGTRKLDRGRLIYRWWNEMLVARAKILLLPAAFLWAQNAPIPFATGASPRTPLWKLTSLPRPLAGFQRGPLRSRVCGRGWEGRTGEGRRGEKGKKGRIRWGERFGLGGERPLHATYSSSKVNLRYLLSIMYD